MTGADNAPTRDLADDQASDRRPANPGARAIRIAGPDLEFRDARIDGHEVDGRRIAEVAGAVPTDEHLVYQMLPNGDLEDIRLEEPVDLRKPGAERFVVFRSAASNRLEIDQRRIDWGAAAITGLVLKKLAGLEGDKLRQYGVWLEAQGQGGEDRPIADDEIVRVDPEGLERFFTGQKAITEGAQ